MELRTQAHKKMLKIIIKIFKKNKRKKTKNQGKEEEITRTDDFKVILFQF